MKIVWPVIVAALVAGGGLIYANRSQGDQAAPTAVDMTRSETSTEATQDQSNSGASSTKTPGAYVDYSSSIVASTAGTKILFFHAAWCPQCRALEASIKSSQVPDGVTIIKVDYDTNQTLRQKYGVTIQTTLVKVDDDGNLVKKYVAYDEPTLSSVINNLL